MTTTNFSQRRESVLNVFQKATAELNALNADIAKEIETNESTVATLQAQNKELQQLKTSNNKTISFFSKIFKA
ncbi:MAG: hypothetical protein RSH25_15665 [Bacteroides sp.]|uniref:hypothetical protein n=1 Tax=Bacteroides sp. TaxID=29523 RepID=UPI002FC91BC5